MEVTLFIQQWEILPGLLNTIPNSGRWSKITYVPPHTNYVIGSEVFYHLHKLP